MKYATVEDVQNRIGRELSERETELCDTLLEDAGVIIDVFNNKADPENKKVVSCRMIIRALGDGTDNTFPIGAMQGSMSALNYSQSWTMASGGGVGELYLGKTDKKLLGYGERIGSYSPVQELVKETEND